MILNGNTLMWIKKKVVGFDYDKKFKFVVIDKKEIFTIKEKLNKIGFNLKFVGAENHLYVEKLTLKEREDHGIKIREYNWKHSKRASQRTSRPNCDS